MCDEVTTSNKINGRPIHVDLLMHVHNFRVNGIKKIIRRRNHDVELLKKRLDKHGDNWRSLPMEAPHPKGKTEQKRRGPKPKNKQPIDGEATSSGATNPAAKKPRKQKVKQPTSPSSIVHPTQPQITGT